MKVRRYILVGTLAAFFAMACDNDGYIDPISKVEPGPDEAAPIVSINYPFEGARIQVKEDVTPINIQLEASDDIEIKSITVSLDGTKLTEFSNFKDYRKATQSYMHNELTNGTHTLTVVATDLSGKSTSSSVTFEKVEPYEPKYPGEIFYMPFDGDYMELLTITPGTPAGNPSFVDGVLGKAVSLTATSKGYVLFPGDTLAGTSDFSLSFWVNPDFVDSNGDGGIDGILGLVNLSNTKSFWGNIDFFVENGSKPSGSKLVVHVTNDDSETWITDASNIQNFFGAWTHHTVTYDGTAHEFKYYINGSLILTKAASWTDALTFKNSGPMVFGAVHFQTTPSLTSATGSQPWASYLTGELDEIRIFNRVLSGTEVETIYDDIMN
jgi:hypothetical protein